MSWPEASVWIAFFAFAVLVVWRVTDKFSLADPSPTLPQNEPAWKVETKREEPKP